MVTIRRTLFASLIALMLLVAALVYTLGARSFRQSTLGEAQHRVNRALELASALFEEELTSRAQDFVEDTSELGLGEEPDELSRQVASIRRAGGFAVLNVCDVEGRPLAGTYSSPRVKVPVVADPILRKALEGHPAQGVIRLSPSRLEDEGGAALQKAMETLSPDGTVVSGDGLFWWYAAPIFGAKGQVAAVRYGGVALNGNFELVDSLRSLAFGTGNYKGKPLGTVTLFLDDTRVATNVIGPAGTRALGTRVSDEVANFVLKRGEVWRDRAFVVDAWYLSGYRPLVSPNSAVVGMLYVGLLETPYTDQERELAGSFLGGVLAILAVAMLLLILLLGGITRPLDRLSAEAGDMARGSLELAPHSTSRFGEIKGLEQAFHEMRAVIADRDRTLTEQNLLLSDANKALEKANRDYMEMLGFVTHEIKSPMAAVHMILMTIMDGYVGEVPDHLKKPLGRIRKNCEELQDMVKNYLDLSRVERGELTATKRDVTLCDEVLEVCREQSAPLFANRHMDLELTCPDGLTVFADPELLRIALSNYLTNAAKYGQEGGSARLEVSTEADHVVISVWNEGAGFSAAEGERLFGKFARLDNATTRAARGSGVGLFLVRQIMELHDGSTEATSKPGTWARFTLRMPHKA